MQLEIRGQHLRVDQELKEHVERRLAFALGRFGSRIADVSVRLADLNGPRGGIDTRCQIVAQMIPSGRMMVEATESEAETAVSAAAVRMGRAIRRELDRRRTPQRGGGRRSLSP